VTVTRDAIVIPDSTEETFSLLRTLRRGRGKKQAASIAYWIYLALFIVAVYGGSLIVAAYRALRHPPPPTAVTQPVLHAAPAGLSALGLLVLLMLLRDALWRGPVILPQVTVDWLLGTPVDRGRLLRPRFRLSAGLAIVVGAAVGIVPAAALVAVGLGGTRAGDVLRLTGAAMLSVALLFAVGTGSAGLIERYQGSWRWLRTATPAALTVAAAFGGLAAWAALGQPPAVLVTVVLWSGPWGWAAQGMTAVAGGAAPLWPLATVLLAALALAALAGAQHAARGVPAAALRIRAAAMGAMSAAVASMSTRGVATAYSGAAGPPRRARFRLRPPRHRQLVLLWRDLLAVGRAPARLAGAVVVTLLAVALIALAGRSRPVSLVPVACALALGYLAAAWLCEGARLDADDPRRSVPLPFRFKELAWWHAAVPCLIMLVVAGGPVAVACVAAGDARLLALLAVTVPVLVAGALVNAYRGDLTPDMFAGFETPAGNTAAINIGFAYALGPVLAVAPMTALLSSAIGSGTPGALARAAVIGAGLAAGLGAYAARRAGRMRAG
jgi:hypothetical protein